VGTLEPALGSFDLMDLLHEPNFATIFQWFELMLLPFAQEV
jgi:hypothetical protein